MTWLLGPLLIAQARQQVVAHLKSPPPGGLPLCIALPHGLLHVCDLLVVPVGLLDDPRDPIDPGAIRNHRRSDGLILGQTLLDKSPGPLHPSDVGAPSMMCIGPIRLSPSRPRP